MAERHGYYTHSNNKDVNCKVNGGLNSYGKNRKSI